MPLQTTYQESKEEGTKKYGRKSIILITTCDLIELKFIDDR